MSTGGPVSVGLAWVEPSRAAVSRLEAMPFDSLWVGGHVASPGGIPEAVVELARLSAMTERVRIGTSVLTLPLYPPAVVAKQVADIDRSAGGRVVLGVGVGGEFPEEFLACGVPVDERGSRTDEAIPLLRRLWSAAPVTHHGRHHSIDGVRIHPAPAQGPGLPIVVAGRGAAAMRRAATLGDGWMPQMYSPRRYAESVREISRSATAAGRPLTGFGWYLFVFVNVDPDGDTARSELLADLSRGGFGRLPPAALDRVTAAGTPHEVAAKLRSYLDAGVEHLVIAPMPRSGRDRTAHLLADEVLPLLRRSRG